jgi:hypothetical protein
VSTQGNERQKLEKLVAAVSAGDFDENQVELVFLQLRDRCFGDRVFREVADFVAHRSRRNKGITKEWLYGFGLHFRYFVEFVIPKRNLEIDKEFPTWIRDLLLTQIPKFRAKDLRAAVGLTAQQLSDGLKRRLKDTTKGFCRLAELPIDACLFKGMQHLLGCIVSMPAYTQEDIIKSLVNVLTRNRLLDPRRTDIRPSSDRIMAGILCLLHCTEFKHDDQVVGICRVGCENENGFLEGHGQPGFGCLVLKGEVEADVSGKKLKVSLPIVMTSLDAWACAAESLQERRSPTLAPGPQFTILNFDHDLALGKGAQIVLA